MPSQHVISDWFRDKIVAVVAASCTIGGGTMILKSAQDNAVQDERIAQQQAITTAVLNKMDALVTEVNDTNKKLERIAGRMEAKDE